MDMGLFSTADVRRTARRTAVLVELGLDDSLAPTTTPAPAPTGPFGLIPRPRSAVDDLIEATSPAPDLRLALVPSPAPVVTPEVLPPSARTGLARRLVAESSTLLLGGLLAIEWASGMFH